MMEKQQELVPVPWKIGTPADLVEIAMKKFHLPFLADPKVIGKDENGMVVQWFLPDSTLTMKFSNGCYRVAEIEPNAGFTLPEVEGGSS
jgi:hypothetical protein